MQVTAKDSIKVGIVNDHTLMRIAMASMINNFENCKTCLHVGSSGELKSEMVRGNVPNILLLDLHMSESDSFEMVEWMQTNYKKTNVIVVTSCDSDFTIRRLLHLGAKAILKKDIYPEELKIAMQSILTRGYYYSNATSRKLLKLLYAEEEVEADKKELLTRAELLFLKHSCSEMTYKEIAEKMNVSLRTVANLRDNLFIKLDIKSRVGLLLYSVRNAIITV